MEENEVYLNEETSNQFENGKNANAKEQTSQNNNNISIVMTSQTINSLLAIIALFLFTICKICINFGVLSGVFIGIMTLFIYLLTLAGAVWAFLRNKKMTFELGLNLSVFVLTALTL